MRAWLVVAVVVVAVVLVGHAHADEAERVQKMVAAQPAIARVDHVVVRGAIARAQQRAMVELVGRVVGDVERRFATGRGRPLSLVLLADDAKFVAAARAFDSVPSTMGFYRPDLRVALANVGNSVGNLRHELVHPLLGDDFPAIPAWLNEGIAALYGTAKWERGKFRFLVNYRLRDLQRAMKGGTLPTLAQLAASTREHVHGDQAGTYYAMARYVLLFAETRGRLPVLYAELKAAKTVAAQQAVLAKHVDERAFLAWAKRLRY